MGFSLLPVHFATIPGWPNSGIFTSNRVLEFLAGVEVKRKL